MSQFEPIHDAHAIESVAIVVQFSTFADESHFTRILEAAKSFAPEFPLANQFANIQVPFSLPGPGAKPAANPVVFQIGGAGPVQWGGAPLVQPSIGAMSYSGYRNDGSLEVELRIERASISYRSTAYTSWRDLCDRALKYFATLLPLFADSGTLASVGLTYLDKFYWKGAPPAIPSELLREGSEYVAPHVFGQKDLWHSHTGAFIRIADDIKRLMNVNLDAADEWDGGGNGRRVVTIATVLTDMFGQPGYLPKVVQAAESPSFFAEYLHSMHESSKEIFGRVVNDYMCRRIALKG